MLSAAHVLAMDAKSLLDVVDSVRVRHPELFLVEDTDSSLAPAAEMGVQPPDLACIVKEEIPVKKPEEISPIDSEGCWTQQQPYENLSMKYDSHDSSLQNEIYVNQEQIKQNTEGLYDNNSIICQQQVLLANNTNTKNRSSAISTTSKPPIAKSGKYC